MTNNELIHQINGLIDLDAACVKAYARALPEIDTPELSDRLQVLYDDHVQRLNELDEMVRRLGGTPIKTVTEKLNDEHHTTIGATLETLKALEEIRSTERAAQLAYDMAAMWDLPEGLKERMLAYRDQEHEDLEFIDKVLVSVRAAASLWGPEDQAPILHH